MFDLLTLAPAREGSVAILKSATLDERQAGFVCLCIKRGATAICVSFIKPQHQMVDDDGCRCFFRRRPWTSHPPSFLKWTSYPPLEVLKPFSGIEPLTVIANGKVKCKNCWSVQSMVHGTMVQVEYNGTYIFPTWGRGGSGKRFRHWTCFASK